MQVGQGYLADEHDEYRRAIPLDLCLLTYQHFSVMLHGCVLDHNELWFNGEMDARVRQGL
jgi:hypothetical protein